LRCYWVLAGAAQHKPGQILLGFTGMLGKLLINAPAQLLLLPPLLSCPPSLHMHQCSEDY